MAVRAFTQMAERNGMSKKRPAIIFFSIFAILGLVLGISSCSSLMDKPLGPSLKGNPSAQPNSTPISTPVTPTTTVQSPAQVQATQLPPLCGNVPVLTVLAVGIDFRGDNYLYGLADVIRIVRIDFTTHTVSVLTLDRAIWVEIPGISNHYGITHGLLNQAYFYGVPAMGYYDGPAGGAGLLAATLKKNFDLDVDNYVVVDMAVFVKMVDALGGIDVNLPAPVDGTPDLPFFNAGKQHLSGTQALELARIREKYSTLIRDSNQDIILTAIFTKLSSPEVIGKIPQLLQAFTGAGLTDLSPRQIENMVCLLKMMGKTDLTFRGIPDKYYVYAWIYDQDMHQDVNIWKIDFNIFRSYISDFMKGQWPQG
jgi:LCP family protein required for cell wall assembly